MLVDPIVATVLTIMATLMEVIRHPHRHVKRYVVVENLVGYTKYVVRIIATSFNKISENDI